MRRILRYANRFNQLSTQEKWRFFCAFFALGTARLTVIAIPFRFYSRFLGHHYGAAAFCVCANLQQQQLAATLGRIIRHAARFTPWRSKCLEQALVAKLFCHHYRLPNVICFGLQKDDKGQMCAHAWTSVGAIAITGGVANTHYTPVSVFATYPMLMRVID